MMLSFRDSVVWLSGYLEGEGYFHLKSRKLQGKTCTKQYFYPSIVLNTTDFDVVARAAQITKIVIQGPINRGDRPNHKPIFRCTVSGDKARGWMMMVYPFMGERRKAAIRAILKNWEANVKKHPQTLGTERARRNAPQAHLAGSYDPRGN